MFTRNHHLAMLSSLLLVGITACGGEAAKNDASVSYGVTDGGGADQAILDGAGDRVADAAGGGSVDATVDGAVDATVDGAVDAARDAVADSAQGSDGDAGGEAGAVDGPVPTTFTQVYDGIISQRCAPCHTATGGIGITMGQLDMTSKMAAFMNLVNVPAAGVACAGQGTRVVPGMPDMSILYLKISHDDPSPCGSKMPLGLPPIPMDEEDTIESWILAGAPNN
jgi:hypothetical protein